MAVLTEAIEAAEGEAAVATVTDAAVAAMTIAPVVALVLVVTTTAAVDGLARDHAPLMMTADTIAPMAAGAPDGMTVRMIALLDENGRGEGAAEVPNVPARLLMKS
jgi:hypothetical protein